VPLSMTTAGREVAGSIRMGKKEVSQLEVDLRQRSKRALRAEDHRREGRFEKREDEEERVGDGEAGLDLKRKQHLNAQELVIAPPISTTTTSIYAESNWSYQFLHYGCAC
jgi:hypothetical protein